MTTRLLSSQCRRLMPRGCMVIPYDVLCEQFSSRIRPRLHMAVPTNPETKPSKEHFSLAGELVMVDLVCSGCGTEIMFLPFSPLRTDPCTAVFAGRRSGPKGSGLLE